MSIFICSFTSGLDEIPRKKQGVMAEVLKVMHERGRFSAFEASATDTLARTVTYVIKNGYVETDKSCGYPWTKVKLTAKGLAEIGLEQPK